MWYRCNRKFEKKAKEVETRSINVFIKLKMWLYQWYINYTQKKNLINVSMQHHTLTYVWAMRCETVLWKKWIRVKNIEEKLSYTMVYFGIFRVYPVLSCTKCFSNNISLTHLHQDVTFLRKVIFCKTITSIFPYKINVFLMLFAHLEK